MDLGPPICQNGPLISGEHFQLYSFSFAFVCFSAAAAAKVEKNNFAADQPAWFQKTVTPVEHPKQTYPIETQHPMFLEKLRGEGKGAQVRMRGRDGRFQPGWRNFHRTTNPPGANRLTKFN
jgi:hypothetical protein